VPSASKLSILGFVLLASGSAEARPIEALEADRAAANAELRDLDRRASSLDDQIGLRQRMLRRRLRALYKVAQGGSLRLLVDASGPTDLSQRLDAAQRIVGRDLHELSALDEEMAELSRDRSRRTDELSRAASLDEQRAAAVSEPPVGLERSRGQLPRPVPGPIVVGFARVRVLAPTSGSAALELPRRNVELASTPGEIVRTVAAGEVRWVGEIDGIGRAVVVDHGDRYLSVTGRLGELRVAVGTHLGAGDPLGTAAGRGISFELSEGRTALDPSPWMRPPTALGR